MLIFKWLSFTFVNLFEISNLWDPTFPHPIILGRSEKWSHRKNIFQAHTLYDTADIHSPIPSFRAQREIFLALCSFLLPSQMDSRFLLSHIRHYPFLQERSLDFGRGDDTGIALSKHFRCTMRGISPYDAKEKSPSQSWSFFVSERLICQTVRAWCLLLLRYQ